MNREVNGRICLNRERIKELLEKFWSKYKIIIVLIAIAFFALVVPIIINFLYSEKAKCSLLAMSWEANDALAFYGTLLASAIGVIGVYWSIQAAQKNYREDVRDKVRPYLTLALKTEKRKFSLADAINGVPTNISSDSNGEKQYTAFRMDTLYAIIESDKVKITNGLTSEQETNICYGGLNLHATASNDRSAQVRGIISLPFEVENVGNGASVDTRVFVFLEGTKRPIWTAYFTISIGQTATLHIYSERADICGKYTIRFRYRDTLGLWYQQDFYIDFKENNGVNQISFDLRGTQKSITEAQANGQT